MSIFTEQQAKAILDKVIALSKADECTATLAGAINGNIRFALNNISTSGIVSDASLAVQVAFGKRVGTASINEFDDAALERVVRRAEDLARLAPENPEFLPAIGRQTYKASPTFSESTGAIDPAFRAKVAADSILPCRQAGVIAAGFLEDGHGFTATANSNGNFGYQRTSNFDFTCTVRTEDGRGYADPWHAEAPVLPWDEEGLPRTRMPIIENGRIANLEYSRFWAQKQGKTAQAAPGNLLMSGGDKSTADLVRGTQKGILVTRTWYIRMVDPQTVLLTGLTRDGTFYIENGQIKHPVKNFRFNESPVIMLNNIDELGKPVRVAGDESDFVMMIPPMRLRDFTFTSLSDAV
jgi:predicted Zn-dependent protease